MLTTPSAYNEKSLKRHCDHPKLGSMYQAIWANDFSRFAKALQAFQNQSENTHNTKGFETRQFYAQFHTVIALTQQSNGYDSVVIFAIKLKRENFVCELLAMPIEVQSLIPNTLEKYFGHGHIITLYARHSYRSQLHFTSIRLDNDNFQTLMLSNSFTAEQMTRYINKNFDSLLGYWRDGIFFYGILAHHLNDVTRKILSPSNLILLQSTLDSLISPDDSFDFRKQLLTIIISILINSQNISDTSSVIKIQDNLAKIKTLFIETEDKNLKLMLCQYWIALFNITYKNYVKLDFWCICNEYIFPFLKNYLIDPSLSPNEILSVKDLLNSIVENLTKTMKTFDDFSLEDAKQFTKMTKGLYAIAELLGQKNILSLQFSMQVLIKGFFDFIKALPQKILSDDLLSTKILKSIHPTSVYFYKNYHVLCLHSAL